MSFGLLMAVAISTLLNVVFIKIKYDKARYMDAGVDLILLILVFVVFKGSFGALATGTVSSMLISIYLWFSPPSKASEMKAKANVKKTSQPNAASDALSAFKEGLLEIRAGR